MLTGSGVSTEANDRLECLGYIYCCVFVFLAIIHIFTLGFVCSVMSMFTEVAV